MGIMRFLLVFFLGIAIGNAQESDYLIRIEPSGDQWLELFGLGLDLQCGAEWDKDGVEVFMTELEFQSVLNTSIKPDVLVENTQQLFKDAVPYSCGWNYDYWETPSHFELGSFKGFLGYDEMIFHLEQMQELWPDLTSSLAPIDSILTHDGNYVLGIRISNDFEANEDEPEILFNALHHAREPASLMQLIFFMYYLLEQYEQGNSEVQYLVDNNQIYFIPCVNPDGFQFNLTQNMGQGGGYWRKNRASNFDGSIGVDLNRNYGFQWNFDNIGSSGIPNSSTYRGLAAFSEPETQAVRNFCEEHEFKLAFNYHSYGDQLLYPWSYDSLATPDSSHFEHLGEIFSHEHHYEFGTSPSLLYAVNGDCDDWMYGEQTTKDKILAFTPEVGPAGPGYGFWPPAFEIERICKAQLRQNLSAVAALHNYTDARYDKNAFIGADSEFTVQLLRESLGEQVKEIGSLSSLSPGLIVNNSSWTREANELIIEEDLSFSFSVNESQLLNGQQIKLLLRIEHENELIQLDTITASYYQELVFVEDACDDLSNWSTDKWDSFTENGMSYLTDSPDGDYIPSDSTFIQFTPSLDLRYLRKAKIEYDTKWAFKTTYDYGQPVLQFSNDSEVALCGNLTSAAYYFQPEGAPLYAGKSLQWRREQLSLDDYLGEELNFILRTATNTNYGEDGIRIDNFVFSGIPDLAPLAADDYLTLSYTEDFTIDLLLNDSDPENDDIEFIAIELVGSADLEFSIIGNSILTVPEAGLTGDFEFSYLVADSYGLTDTATVQLSWTNNAPLVEAVSLTTDFSSPIAFDLFDFASDENLEELNFDLLTEVDGLEELANGSFVFTPTEGLEQEISIEFIVTDELGESAALQIDLVVEGPPNEAPIVENASLTTDFISSISFNLFDYVSDENLEELSFDLLAELEGLAQLSNGAYLFTPTEGFEQEFTIEFVVTDEYGLSANFFIAINVESPPNEAPLVIDDFVELEINNSITVDVLANDSDAEGLELVIAEIVTVSAGTASIDENGFLHFIPELDFSGELIIEFIVEDAWGAQAESVLTITVFIPNQAPVASDDFAELNMNGTITVDFLGNDYDSDGVLLSFSILEFEDLSYELIVNDEGYTTILLTPFLDFWGMTELSYSVTDEEGLVDTATIFLTVNYNNPIAVNDTVVTAYGESLLIDVLTNDIDPQGWGLTLTTLFSSPENGSVNLTPDGQFEFIPDEGFFGIDAFQYYLVDAEGIGADALVFIEVLAPVSNVQILDAPVIAVNEEICITVNWSDYIFDPDGSIVSINVNSENGFFTEDIDWAGSNLFCAFTDFSDDGQISFSVTDEYGYEYEGLVGISIMTNAPEQIDTVYGSINQLSYWNVFNGDRVLIEQGTITEIEFVENSTDFENYSVNASNHRVLSLVATEAGFYSVNYVKRIADELMAARIVFAVSEESLLIANIDSSVTIVNVADTIAVLLNDNFFLGSLNDLQLKSISNDRGIAEIIGDEFVYDGKEFLPDEAYPFAFINYELLAPNGRKATGFIVIEQIFEILAPTAIDDGFVVSVNDLLNGSVVLNDYHEQDLAFSFFEWDLINYFPACEFELDANGGFSASSPFLQGEILVAYELVTDGFDLYEEGMLLILFEGDVNDSFNLTPDSVSLIEGYWEFVNPLINDEYLGTEELSIVDYQEIGDADGFSELFFINGQWLLYGSELGSSANYYIVDNSLGSYDNSTIISTTLPFEENTVLAEDDYFSLLPLETIEETVTLNDLSGLDVALFLRLLSEPENGSLEFDSNGHFIYTANDSEQGIDQFTYVLSDHPFEGQGNADTAVVTIEILPIQFPPTTVVDSFTYVQNTELFFADLLTNDFDDNGDVLHVTEIGEPLNGSLFITTDSSFIYTPNDLFVGTDSLSYTVEDETGLTTIGWIVIIVEQDTGLENWESAVVIFPNPCRFNCWLDISTQAAEFDIMRIVDSTGKEVCTSHLPRKEIELGQLLINRPSGIYFLQLVGEAESASVRFLWLP